MDELKIFNNPEFGEIRIIEIDGEPWMVGKDVAMALGYKNPQEAVRVHVDDEDKGVSEILTPGGRQNAPIINESGLYSLVLSSKLPGAKKFRRWVTSEVLPSIRKHGLYATETTVETMLADPDTAIRLLQEVKEEREKRKALEAANSALTVDNQIMKPKAEYFDELVDRNLLTNFRETAKELKIKERKFIRFLLDEGYIYRDLRNNLRPYAQFVSVLFEVKECYNEKTHWYGTQTLVTPKGRETFRLLCKTV